jgi:hypothetical protein
MATPRTFVELVEHLRIEAGLEGLPLTDFSSLPGQGTVDKLPGWINTAYSEIVGGNRWRFAWRVGTVIVPAGSSVVDTSSVDNGLLLDIDAFQVRANGSILPKEDYNKIRDGNQTGAPTCFAFRPDDSIVIYPAPASDCTITFDYWLRSVADLVNETDEPILPASMRDLIVWKALMNYCANDAASELFQYAQSRYTDRYLRLASVFGGSDMRFAMEPLA